MENFDIDDKPDACYHAHGFIWQEMLYHGLENVYNFNF